MYSNVREGCGQRLQGSYQQLSQPATSFLYFDTELRISSLLLLGWTGLAQTLPLTLDGSLLPVLLCPLQTTWNMHLFVGMQH